MRSLRTPLASVVVTVAALVSACSGLPNFAPGTSGSDLTFAQVQAIQPGLTSDQVIDAYGQPKRMSRCEGGTIERMEYSALDAKNGRNSLFLDFNRRGVLTQKTFTGAILKP